MALFPGDMSIGWGFGLEHCTGSPTCQCSECRLTEHNANEAPEDQLPHGYKYESPETKAAREVGLYAMDESQPTDPLLAVSELEQRVLALQGQVLVEQTRDIEHLSRIQQLEQRVTDLEERFRSLVFVVNVLCSSVHDVMHQGKE